MLRVAVDDRETMRFLSLAPARIDRAEMRAVRRATTGARTDASRVLRGDIRLNIKARDLKRFIVVTRPRGRSPVGYLDISRKPVPLIRFGARPSRPEARRPRVGASVAVIKGRRKRIEGAFVARVGAGHIGIFRRKGAKRLPIEELKTAGPGHYLDQGEGRRKVEDLIGERLKKEMDRALKYELKKAAGII
jgi:hypothetical protein